MPVNPSAAKPLMRLFCFPYAGGGASLFRASSADLPREIALCPIQLPGRETRFAEAAHSRMNSLVDAVTAPILSQSDLPFAFFGHSMGALIAFELARTLRRLRRPGPVHLFVSGRKAPQLPDLSPPVHHLPTEEFVTELRRLNGTPDTVFDTPGLLEVVLPTLRADFAVSETYEYIEEPPLNCSLSAFGGFEDPDVSQSDLEAWRIQTRSSFTWRVFPGDHWYLAQEARANLFKAISDDLACVLRACGR